MQKLLVANRAEIAIRISRAAAELGKIVDLDKVGVSQPGHHFKFMLEQIE